MTKDVDTYFALGCGRCPRFGRSDCSTQRWAQGLVHLRRLCQEAGLQETCKWGHPCYMHRGRNIAILGAFRANFRLSFFHPSLMTDPDNILEKAGKNTRDAGCMIFSSNEQPAGMASIITAYLKEAKSYAEAGIKPERKTEPVRIPVVLAELLAADPALFVAFDALTEGRKRAYVLHVEGAKKMETKRARMARCREKILLGKGPNEL